MRVRKTICKAGFTALACLAVMAVRPAAADDAKACGLSRYAALDMRTTANGLVTIPVKVQDQEYPFVVDTMAGVGMVGPRLVAAANLQLLPTASSLKYVRIPKFAIGTMDGHDVEFFASDRSVAEGADGILRPNLLRRFDLDFDFAASKFNLMSADHCTDKVVYWTNDPAAIAKIPMRMTYGNGIEIPVAIDGKHITASIQTGTTATIMTLRTARVYLDVNENTPGVEARNVNINGTPERAYTYPFKTLNFGGVTVNNPDIVIVDDNNLGPDLLIGIGVLRALHLYVAYREQVLYVTAAGAH